MNQDQALVEALVAAQADAGGDDRLLTFYEQLVRAIQAQKGVIAALLSPEALQVQARARLKEGAPALSFDDLGIESATFLPWLRDIAALFDSYDPGASDELEAIESLELLSLARQWFDAGETGFGPAVDALLANALAPWLEEAAATLAPQLPLKSWELPFCPMCGGFPDFALWDDQRNSRDLLCERCQTIWRFRGPGCLFCGEDDPNRLGFYSSEDDLYRVDVCDSCGHYIKMIDRTVAAHAGLSPHLAAERLLTPGLDVLAAQEGYSRPTAFPQNDAEPDGE